MNKFQVDLRKGAARNAVPSLQFQTWHKGEKVSKDGLSLFFSDVFIGVTVVGFSIIYWREPKGRGGGEYSRKFYMARLLPKVQPLTLRLLSV